MFESIKRDFTNVWNRPGAGLQKIIIVNVGFFIVLNLVLLFISGSPSLAIGFERLIMAPVQFRELIFRPWTFVTNFYAHLDFWHILFNMLWLYHFGKILDQFLGSDKVVAVYVLGGLFGTFLVVLYYSLFAPTIDTVLLGASGAVIAVAGAAATLSPDYQMNLMFFGPVKIKYIFLVMVLISVLSLGGGNTGGQIAHIGGGIMGYLYIIQLKSGNNIGQWVINLIDAVYNVFKPKKIRVSYRKPRAKTRSSRTAKAESKFGSKGGTKQKFKTSQAEVDAILDKINESGYDSLTKQEKEKLFNAGK